VIPAANQVHLMLKEEVRQAVADGTFHVFTAATVEDALELLTGFSATSIEATIDARLNELIAAARKFSDKATEDSSPGADGD